MTARELLPPLVASYDLRGDAVAWLCRCWHTSFAHGSMLEWAMMSPPFIPRVVGDVDVILRALIGGRWLEPMPEPTPTFNQAALYLMSGGSHGLSGLRKMDRAARERDDGVNRELRFYGFEPVRTCEPYRALVVGEMQRGAA